MNFFKSKFFKYLKNLIIGVGAAIVLLGALFKIESWPHASEMLILGLSVEAGLFLMLGILGPDPDYYWDKLYPGLSDYNAKVSAITPEFIGGGGAQPQQPQLPGLDGKIVEQNLVGMLTELKKQSATLGSLDALRQADFSGVQDKVKTMNSVYNKLTMAMESMTESIEDTKMYKQQMEMYKEQIKKLNDNLTSLNGVYGGMLTAMRGGK
ncbi:MAG: hypothetical protein RIS64_3306 [Bacteroidota bacterium]|jgi:hypothetical protein